MPLWRIQQGVDFLAYVQRADCSFISLCRILLSGWSFSYGHLYCTMTACGTHHLSNMCAVTTELFLIGFMHFHWLRKVFDLPWGQVLGRVQYLEQASEQIYQKKTFWWQTDQESVKQTRDQDFPMYYSQGSVNYLVYFAQKQFQFFSNFHWVICVRNRLPGDECTMELIRIPKVRQFFKQ